MTFMQTKILSCHGGGGGGGGGGVFSSLMFLTDHKLLYNMKVRHISGDPVSFPLPEILRAFGNRNRMSFGL